MQYHKLKPFVVFNSKTTTMDEAKRSRAAYKGVISKDCKFADILIAESDIDDITTHKTKMKNNFRKFLDASEVYNSLLTGDDETTAAEDYYDEVSKLYMCCVNKLNLSINNLKTVQTSNKDDVSSLSAISQIINMPKLEFKPFDGSAFEFHKFMSIFKQSVEICTPDPTLRLTRLLCHTTGAANKAISNIDLADSNCYDRAIQILTKNFGSKYIICTTIVNDLKGGPMAGTSNAIRDLANELRNAEICLKREGMYGELDTQSCIVSVCKRLQRDLREKWSHRTTKRQRESSEYLTFSDFVNFIEQEADRLNDPIFGRDLFEQDEREIKSHTSLAVASNVQPNRQRFNCILCSNNHKLFFCSQFKDMSLDDRFKFVTKHKLCINCLFSNHTSIDCPRPYVCNTNGCRLRHCRYLHRDTQVTANLNVNDSNIMLPIVPIIVNNIYHTYALLDTGSSHTFCARHLVDALDISGSETNYDLQTLGNIENRSAMQVDLSVQPRDQSTSFNLNNVLVIDKVPVNSSAVDLSKFTHLSDISHPGPASVEVLIGQNYADLLVIDEYRRGHPGEPYAAKTALGWCFHGPTATNPSHLNVTSNLISTKLIEEKLDHSYELEQVGIHRDTEWSIEDTEVIEVWKEACTIDENHYSLPIPWRYVDSKLPNNYYLAKCRLNSNNLEEAKQTIVDVTNILSDRSFKLTKFIANDPRILTDVNTEDKQDNAEFHKALRIGWYTETTRLKISWKLPLPADLRSEWNSWTDDMIHYSKDHIVRCMIPSDFIDGTFELHIFSDASSQAYGSVVYLRCLNKFGNIHVNMVCSKNRVCPIKSTITIPRLELQAAVLSTTLEEVVTRALSVELLETSYWTDSMVVLGFINNSHRRFHTYVANRLGKIRSSTTPKQRFFISGESNPADLLTRKRLPSNFDQASWYNGPTYLITHKDKWSETRFVSSNLPCMQSLSDAYVEAKSGVTFVGATHISRHPPDTLIEYFSGWTKLYYKRFTYSNALFYFILSGECCCHTVPTIIYTRRRYAVPPDDRCQCRQINKCPLYLKIII